MTDIFASLPLQLYINILILSIKSKKTKFLNLEKSKLLYEVQGELQISNKFVKIWTKEKKIDFSSYSHKERLLPASC